MCRMVIRRVRFNIPDFILQFQEAYITEDFERCNELKTDLTNIWEESSEDVRSKMKSFIIKYLDKFDIDMKKDLGGIFDIIFQS